MGEGSTVTFQGQDSELELAFMCCEHWLLDSSSFFCCCCVQITISCVMCLTLPWPLEGALKQQQPADTWSIHSERSESVTSSKTVISTHTHTHYELLVLRSGLTCDIDR